MHNYVITTITYFNSASGNPQVTIQGTVDGVTVTAFCYLSEGQAALKDVPTFEAFIASRMLDAYNQITPVVFTPPVSSFTL